MLGGMFAASLIITFNLIKSIVQSRKEEQYTEEDEDLDRYVVKDPNAPKPPEGLQPPFEP